MPTRAELLAYLDELLPPARSAEIEERLRGSEDLRLRAAALLSERDSGAHTLGEIARRRRVFCPGPDRLGQHLLGTLDPNWGRAVDVHLSHVGCRFCEAELAALRDARTQSAAEADTRTRHLFNSTIGVRRS